MPALGFRKSTRLRALSLGGIAALSMALGACSSPPPPKKVSVSERVQYERAVGLELSQQFDPELKFKKDLPVTSYLRKLGQTLADATPDLHLPSVEVALIADPGGKRASFGLPGGKLYVSIGMLKPLDYENEVAAVLAMELGHLQKEQPQEYLKKNYADLITTDRLFSAKKESGIPSVRYQGSGGLFDYSEKQDLDAAERAVDILYNAGYDPRGLVTLWQKLEAVPGRSLYTPAILEKLLESTRRVVALHSPLRNPIVRTQAFGAIHKRLQNL